MGAEQIRVQRKEQVIPALDTTVTGLRRKLGESLSSSKYDTSIEQATTPSLEAFHAYNEGLRAWDRSGNEAAILFYRRAIDLDPSFAMAYAHLASAQANLGLETAEETIGKAFRLRDRVSEPERLYIDRTYYLIYGDREDEIRTLEQWRQLYPDDTRPARDLALDYGLVGRYEDALAQARDLVRLEPHSSRYQSDLAEAAIRTNRLDEARTILNPTGRENLDLRYELAFLRGDAAEMQKLLTQARTIPEAASFLLYSQAYTEAYHGHMQNARNFEHQIESVLAAWNDRASAQRWTTSFQIDQAVLNVEFGYRDQGRMAATTLLAKSKHPGDEDPTAGLALARGGDTLGAQVYIGQVLKRNPKSTELRAYWIPTVRAAILLAKHNPEEAVRELDSTSGCELGSVISYYTAPLFPVYLRGQAFLAMNKGTEAAAEFQKYVDHPGVVKNYPLAALARLGLARAYAISRDRDKAAAAYRDFLTLWQDADPDIPILKQAKAEYAKLQ